MLAAGGMWETNAAYNSGQATLQRRENGAEDLPLGAEPSLQDIGATSSWCPSSAGAAPAIQLAQLNSQFIQNRGGNPAVDGRAGADLVEADLPRSISALLPCPAQPAHPQLPPAQPAGLFTAGTLPAIVQTTVQIPSGLDVACAAEYAAAHPYEPVRLSAAEQHCMDTAQRDCLRPGTVNSYAVEERKIDWWMAHDPATGQLRAVPHNPSLLDTEGRATCKKLLHWASTSCLGYPTARYKDGRAPAFETMQRWHSVLQLLYVDQVLQTGRVELYKASLIDYLDYKKFYKAILTRLKPKDGHIPEHIDPQQGASSSDFTFKDYDMLCQHYASEICKPGYKLSLVREYVSSVLLFALTGRGDEARAIRLAHVLPARLVDSIGPSACMLLPIIQEHVKTQASKEKRMAGYGTVHRLPSALYTAAMATVPQPEHEPAAVQELPKLGVYTSVQQICDAWFTGLDGQPPLKELPPEQRLPKQRWSDWGLFMAEPAQLMAAGQTLEQVVRGMERERAKVEQARFKLEEAKFAACRKGKVPKRPPLTISGYVRHKNNKQRWDA